jgi:hypothetical protein
MLNPPQLVGRPDLLKDSVINVKIGTYKKQNIKNK